MGKDITMDVVIVGQQPWDIDIGSNCKNIAIELAKSRRVLYVNSPLDRISRYKGRHDHRVQKRVRVIRGEQDGLEQIGERLWTLYPDKPVESINWISHAWIFDWLNKRNNRLFAQCIQKAVAALGFGDFILFNDNEIFKAFYLREFLRPSLSIYYSRDYMLAVDYWKKHGQRLEPVLIAENDLCVANSAYLADYCRQYNPHSFDVGQGCDIALFDQDGNVELPTRITRHPGPVIGYVGALQESRLDMAVIEHIANSQPDWLLVLVGPESEAFKASNLHQFANVMFTGIKPLEELASYMASFDVCINPQRVNELTIGNYPRKIDEYLLMGKPTVATATRAMEVFKNWVLLARSKEEYVTLIKQAIDTDSEKRKIERMAFARTHTWENSVSAINQAIITSKLPTP